METKEIYVEGYTYYNEENGYAVLETAEKNEFLIVVGYVSEDLTGETLKVSGQTVIHPSYGRQFKMAAYEVIEPTDEEGIRRYLSSGVIKGIGAALTERLLSAFGSDVLRIMEQEPERLAEVKGISLRKAQELGIQVEEKKHLRSAMMFLQKYGISNKMAVRIYDCYGDDLFDAIRENPYCLAGDVEGIGFKSADEIARRMGFSMLSPHRLKSGVLYVLEDALQEGNTYLPHERLLAEASRLLEVEEEQIAEVLSDLAMEKKIVVRSDHVYEKRVYTAEQRCAALLLERNWVEKKRDASIPSQVEKIGEQEGLKLDPLQIEAVCESLNRGVFILTGGPGTGKTTTLNTMIRVFLQQGKDLMLAAPTGRAAKRMSEATGYEAKTIHRLLEVKAGEDGVGGYFERNEENPLEADVLIVDEMSMVDLFLFQALLRALPPETHLVLVGDPGQLPSVGPGQVLADLIESGLFKTVQLETIFRQAEESHIVLNAHAIRRGEAISLTNSREDFVFLQRDAVRSVRENLLTMITKVMPRHFSVDTSRIQVLTPVKKGPLGTEELNILLQRYLNPPTPDKEEREFGDKLLRVGDKVMQTKNDYRIPWKIFGRHQILLEEGEGIFNGDVGMITSISAYERTLTVQFEDGKTVVYGFDQTGPLELAYAMTIHKSQGSEYPVVLLPLLHVPPQMLYRNLLYTAVTRAEQCVVLLGQPETVIAMIEGENRNQRYTGLKDRLEEMGYEEK